MPSELALKAVSYGLIWFSFLLLLVALLVSQRKEYNLDKVSRQVFPFTLAMIGLWALIALGIIYTQSNKDRSLEQDSTVGAVEQQTLGAHVGVLALHGFI